MDAILFCKRNHCWFIFLIMMVPIVLLTSAMADSEPHFPENATWFNVTRPLTSVDLKGHIVLLDFFTPGCINCIHTLPMTKLLRREFGNRLLVIGVNSPKFMASRNQSSIAGFIQRYGIHHPIITDKNMRLWTKYGVFAWPTFVLLSGNGKILGHYIGEGHYRKIRTAIIKALTKTNHSNLHKVNSILPLKPLSAPNTPLLQPEKVAVNQNYVAVSDTGHNRIVIFNHHGEVISIIGNGHRGKTNGPPLMATFNAPSGLAFYGNVLLVADTGNQLIRSIDLKDFNVRTIAGNGKLEYGVHGQHQALDSSLNSPWGLDVIRNDLYIAMAGDHQVWKMNLTHHTIGPFAGSGIEGITDGPALQAEFAQSSGLAVNKDNLYVADPESSAIRVVNIKSLYVHTLVGKGLFVFGLRNGPINQALLQHDQGLTLLQKKLYIADTFNNAIRSLNLVTDRVSTLAIGLAQPGGLAVLNHHHLIVTDTNHNRLVTVNTINGHVSPWVVHGLRPPQNSNQ